MTFNGQHLVSQAIRACGGVGGFDTQVKTAQAVFAEAFRHVMRVCFLMDEKLFGDIEKEVRGVNAGAPYELTYKPKDAIRGDYWVDVTYGLMAGLDPNRALVFGLQARGDKLISRDFLRRQMPWEINVTMEEEKVQIEELRDALIQAVSGYAQALPAMVAQGQDPSKILTSMAKVIQGRQKGQPIEEVIEEAFETPEQEQMESPEVAAAGEAPAPGQAPTGAPSEQQGQLPEGLHRPYAGQERLLRQEGHPAREESARHHRLAVLPVEVPDAARQEIAECLSGTRRGCRTLSLHEGPFSRASQGDRLAEPLGARGPEVQGFPAGALRGHACRHGRYAGPDRGVHRHAGEAGRTESRDPSGRITY